MKKKKQKSPLAKRRPKKGRAATYEGLVEERKRQPAPALTSEKPSEDQSEAV